MMVWNQDSTRLYRCLTRKSPNPVYESGDTTNNRKMHLDGYLGSGAFSHVSSATLSAPVAGEKDTFIVKVPNSLAAVKSLENVLKKILRALKKTKVFRHFTEIT
jgi:hypothetical protein